MKDNTAAVHVQVPVEVTSFLLNEKRTEITKIELKQRVTVLLVPNKNLDTPNYRLERLRQDDPRLDNLQASYKMIDEPEEEVGFTRREKAKAKQEPVIKGILPETPAPQPQAKPVPVEVVAPPVVAPVVVAATPPAEGGFFSWLKRLFGSSPEPVAVPVPTPVAKAATGSATERGETRGEPGERGAGGSRGGRGGRGGRDGRRGERGDRPERSPSEGREGRDGGKGRGDRGPRSDRPERNPNDETARPETTAAEVAGGGRNEERPARPDERPEGRGEARPERGGRGPRSDRDGQRRPRPSGDANTDNAEPTGAQAELQAPPQAGDAPEAQGEAQPGRRRGRRGGRGGRDRDEARDGENRPAGAALDDSGLMVPPSSADNAPDSGLQAQADGQAEPAMHGTDGGERPESRHRGPGRDRNRRPRRDEAAAAPVQLALAGDMAFDAERADEVRPVEALTEAPAVHDVTAVQTPMPMPMPMPMPASIAAPMAAPMSSPTPAPTLAPATTPAAFVPPAAPALVAAVAATPAVSVPRYELPLSTLQAIAASSGLEWINSDADKIRSVQEAMAREPRPMHVPRERKPPVQLDDGPLVLVETRKDLSQIKLPFEAADIA